MSVTEYNMVLDRRVRKGDRQDQLVPTYVKIREAIEADRRDDALEYIDFFDLEAAHVYAFVYAAWLSEIGRFLRDKGVQEAQLASIRAELELLVNRRFADGVPYDREAEIRRYQTLKAQLIGHVYGLREVACESLMALVVQWRSIHDRDLDYVAGLLNAVHERLGEEELETLYRDYLLVDVFKRGFGRFDVSQHDWSTTFDSLVAFQLIGARLHLADLGRSEPSVTLQEFDDRVEVTMAPCGSGGRITAGDAFSSTPSRAEAPYHYRFIEREHDFSWNKKGVCDYCAHCCLTYEKMPIEKYGYPVMVVDPPTYPDSTSRCRITMYRNPRDVPVWVYERVGETKPDPQEPLGSAGRTAHEPN